MIEKWDSESWPSWGIEIRIVDMQAPLKPKVVREAYYAYYTEEEAREVFRKITGRN